MSTYIIAVSIAIPIFIRFSLYRAIIRYIGFKALWRVVQAVTLYAILWGIVGFMAASQGTGSILDIPRSVIFINWALVLLVIVGLRLVARWIFTNDRYGSAINVVIYGAGTAGRQLFNALAQSNEYNTVAFIDDNDEMHSQSINGMEGCWYAHNAIPHSPLLSSLFPFIITIFSL